MLVKTGAEDFAWYELVRCSDRMTAAGHRGVSSFGHGDGGFPGHPANAKNPMSTGPPGRAISLKDVHPWKAECPISVRLGGSVISLKEVHSKKADGPILARSGGSVISLKDVHW